MSILTKLRRKMMLTCKDVNLFLVEYIEGTMDPKMRSRFEKHVDRCPQCKTYLQQYSETIAQTRDAGDVPAAPEMLVEHTLVFLRQHYPDSTNDRPK